VLICTFSDTNIQETTLPFYADNDVLIVTNYKYYKTHADIMYLLIVVLDVSTIAILTLTSMIIIFKY